MKKVFDAKMVCHLWANKAQDEARTAGGNLYFTGPTLYSYGSHFVIGHWLDDGKVLMNQSGYSNTTNKHKGYAWQALSGWTRRDSVLWVPELSDNTVRDLSSCKTGHRKGQLPQLAELCVQRAIELVSSIAIMRSVDKMNATLTEARSMERTANALAAYVQTGRKALRTGLPVLPDAVPADKETRAAWIRSVAKAKLVALLAKQIELFDGIENRIIGAIDGAGYATIELHNDVAGMKVSVNAIANAYRAAHGKAIPKTQLAKLQARVDALEPRAAAAQKAYWFNASEAEILRTMRFMAKRKRAGLHAGDIRHSIRAYETQAENVSTAASRLSGFTDDKHWLIPVAARIGRVLGYHMAVLRLDSAGQQIVTADSYGTAHPGDAKRHYANAMRLLELSAYEHNGHRAIAKGLPGLRRAALLDQAQAGFKVADAAVREKEAGRMAAWLDGSSNVVPFGLVLARIKGDAVQTTLGATVPLEHACRLARIARRVIASGGREWANDDGPMVGHFRVRSIGADGRTEIGCHVFDADEALRMLALLDSCEACKAHATEGVAA